LYRADTIVACATPPGRGAIAVVRVSGPLALTLAGRLFRSHAASPAPARHLEHGAFLAAAGGEPIDDVLLVRMPAPRSYTGEDVVEIHCHGSPVVVELVVAAAIGAGARAAERGEFTRRAVLNGRIDLAQAEAVADLIDARVEGGARAAWGQLQGALSQRLGELRGALVEVLSDVEANVDFSDEELPEESVAARTGLLSSVTASIDEMLAAFPAARRQREGYRTVFVGRPNVGKSSLVNALLGHGRMIVSDEPGTTRDSVEEVVDLGGAAFVLTDTAGLRRTPGAAERAAVARSREKIHEADILVTVLDGSTGLDAHDRQLLESTAGRVRVVVVNKSDLPDAMCTDDRSALDEDHDAPVRASALTGEGCAELVAALKRRASTELGGDAQPVGISRVRHRAALEATRAALGRAGRLVADGDDAALAALELRTALTELASITDPVDNEDVLDRIFSTFCIGK